ncbi:hypothetical protein [Salinibacterium sp. ZJ454]|nr:hypothetical protein [Salinibacterium sp. ZJ454]
MASGLLNLDSVRTHMIPLDDAARMYDSVERDLDEYLGVVLTYAD